MVIERYIDKEGAEVHAGRPMHFPHMFCGYKINEPSERASSSRASRAGETSCDLCYRLVREMIPRGLPTFLPGRD